MGVTCFFTCHEQLNLPITLHVEVIFSAAIFLHCVHDVKLSNLSIYLLSCSSKLNNMRPLNLSNFFWFRARGKENFFHCDKCGFCLALEKKENHTCRQDISKNNCPICLEVSSVDVLATFMFIRE